MPIDTDILKLSNLDWLLKSWYAPMVRHMMKHADPLTAFINDATMDCAGGDYMKIPLTDAPDGSIVFGNIASDAWPNAGRSYGKQLQIAPSDMVEMFGSLKIELKAEATAMKNGTTVGDQIREQLIQQADDLKRKSAMLTTMNQNGQIGSLSEAGSLTAGYITLSDSHYQPHLLYPGLHICGGSASAVTGEVGGRCPTIDWNGIIRFFDHKNRRAYWAASPCTGTGTGTLATNASIAANDGVWLFDPKNTDEVGGMYGVPTWMNSTFTNYNVDRTTDNSWRFFSCEATDGGSDTLTLDDIETTLIDHNMQTGKTPDMGLISPSVFKTAAHLEDDKKRLNLDPVQKPDFILGYNRIWVMAGVGQVPLVVDPTFFNDRIYFLRRQDWYRIVLREFGPQPHGKDGSAWYTDDTYGFKKARFWGSQNFVCLDPGAQKALTGITA